MKIVLAEEFNNGGQSPSEKSFNQDIIRIGRDAADCQIVFDNKQFPMVSRKHAELRFSGGQWFVYDLNSSYGTFADGQKLSAPQTVKVGSRLQFGTNGPVISIVWIEEIVAAPVPASRKPCCPTPPENLCPRPSQMESVDKTAAPH